MELVETPTTPVADVVEGVLDDLKGHPLMAGVDVTDGWPGDEQAAEAVWVSEVNSSEVLAYSTGEGQRAQRTETTRIVLIVELIEAGRSARQVSRRLAEIEQATQDVIANDSNRSGLVDWVEIVDKDHHAAVTPNGAVGLGQIVLSYSCSLT